MPRQLYFRSQVGLAGVNLPAMPHVAHVPQTRKQSVELLHGLAGLGEAAARVVIARDNQRQAGLVEEAYNSAREQMARWTADYQRGHQGGNALDAQAAYEQQWAKISAGIREQYGDRMYGGTQALLGRRLELGRIQALEHGAAYQQRQTSLWHDDLDKRSLALLEADIAADPGNLAFHDVRLRETLDGMRQRHPGRDFTGTELKLRQNVAEAQFNGLLARGDLAGAEELLNRHTVLGSRLGYDDLQDNKSGTYVPGRIWHGGGVVRGLPPSVEAKLEAEARRQGVDPILVKAVAMQESNGRQSVVSHAGAVGVMQVMPQYVNDFGGGDVHNEDDNIRLGVRELKAYLGQAGGDVREALLRYNWGPGNVAAYKKTGKGIRGQAMPKEAREYADRVLGRISGGNFEGSGVSRDVVTTGRDVVTTGRDVTHDKQDVTTTAPSGRYGGLLPPDQLLRMRGKLDHARRERAQQAGMTAENFSNHLTFGLDSGDFSAAEHDIATLRSLGLNQEAETLAQRLHLAQTAYSTLAGVSDLPFVEQATAARKRMQALVTPDNAKQATTLRDHVTATLDKRQKAFIADPAAYVAQMPAMQGEHLNTEDRILHSLQLQERMGRGLNFTPQVLSKPQAEELRRNYDALKDPLQRAGWLRQMSTELGQFTADAFRQMKVPDSVITLLPVLPALSEKTLGTFMHAAEAKASDIAGDTEWKQAAKDALSGSDLVAVTQSMARAFPANPALRTFAKNMQETFAKYQLLGGNVDELEKAFDSHDTDNCFLLLPKNRDFSASDVADAANARREKLLAQAMANIPDATTQAGRLARANITGMFENGIFISDESGQRVVLVDATTGHPLAYKGKVVAYDIEELLRKRKRRGPQLVDVDDAGEE